MKKFLFEDFAPPHDLTPFDHAGELMEIPCVKLHQDIQPSIKGLKGVPKLTGFALKEKWEIDEWYTSLLAVYETHPDETPQSQDDYGDRLILSGSEYFVELGAIHRNKSFIVLVYGESKGRMRILEGEERMSEFDEK